MTDLITDNLLEKIGHGQLKMRPRWHFALCAVLATIGFFLVFGITFFLVAFLMLTIRTSGLTELPGFGWAGTLALLKDFPWFLALLLLALMAGLELYARRFPLSYKRRVMTTIGVLVVLLGGSGIALGAYIERVCPDDGPISYAFGRMRAQAMHRSVFLQRGTFIEMREAAAVIVDDDGTERLIPISDEMPLLGAPTEGDEIVIFGLHEAGQFQAKGLRKRVPSRVLPLPPRGLCTPNETRLSSPESRGAENRPVYRRLEGVVQP